MTISLAPPTRDHFPIMMMSRGELGFGFFLFIVTLRNFTIISRLPSLFCDECSDRYSEQSGDSHWPWMVVTSYASDSEMLPYINGEFTI
jgi:hypothetical protein